MPDYFTGHIWHLFLKEANLKIQSRESFFLAVLDESEYISYHGLTLGQPHACDVCQGPLQKANFRMWVREKWGNRMRWNLKFLRFLKARTLRAVHILSRL